MTEKIEKSSKSFLEKRIHERAVYRFEHEWDSLISALKNNEIAKQLRLGKNKWLLVPNGTDSYSYLSQKRFMDDWTHLGAEKDKRYDDPEFTNYLAIKEKLISEYEDEETDQVLRQLDEVKSIINGD